MFEESIRGFKDQYFLVRPKDAAGWSDVLVTRPKVGDDDMIFKGPDGNPIMVDYSQFHFKWVKDHYLLPASTFVYNKREVNEDVLLDYLLLCDYIDGFKPTMLVDEELNPLYNEDGTIRT
jgi:hypothetical protein